MQSRIYILAFLLLAFFSCANERIDTKKAKEEMEAREIKVVSDAQILERAMALGNKVSSKFSVAKNDNEWKFDFGMDTLYKKGHYRFDEPVNLEGKAKQLFDAYEYNQSNVIKSEANVQKLDGGKTLLYTKPIMVADSSIGMWTIEFSRKSIVLSIKD